MCEGGRVRRHLRHNLSRPECAVVFAGFQAAGTLGRQIVDGEALPAHALRDEVRRRGWSADVPSAHQTVEVS